VVWFFAFFSVLSAAPRENACCTASCSKNMFRQTSQTLVKSFFAIPSARIVSPRLDDLCSVLF
jgi:hypothetical protein